jgi:hypothetical protein
MMFKKSLVIKDRAIGFACLDKSSGAATGQTLEKAAIVLGKRRRVELV